MRYSIINRQVTGGNYDDTTGTLTVMENLFDPIGSVNLTDKSISGTIDDRPFMLSYQGSD